MDLSTAALLGVFAVLGVNQLVMRVGALYAHPAVFYALQAVDVLVGSAILWFGLPGLEQWRVVSWMIGLLFFFHAVQNNNLRATWLRERVRADRARKERAIREALAASDEE